MNKVQLELKKTVSNISVVNTAYDSALAEIGALGMQLARRVKFQQKEITQVKADH